MAIVLAVAPNLPSQGRPLSVAAADEIVHAKEKALFLVNKETAAAWSAAGM